MQATGTLTITAAQAGYYTFGVNSDDGFMLSITGANFSNGSGDTTCSGSTLEYDGGRAAADTLGTTYLVAGSYPINLIYFQGGGRCEHGVLRCQGEQFRGGDFLRLQFDSRRLDHRHHGQRRHQQHDHAPGWSRARRSPALAAAAAGCIAAAMATNVKSAVESAISAAGGTSLYVRIPFTVSAANLSSLTSLTLKMQYADGYVAYLNGVEIASENAPSFAHVELAGQRGTNQRRAGHDLRGRRRFQLPQFGRHRPHHHHRHERPGHPGPVAFQQRHRHAGRT